MNSGNNKKNKKGNYHDLYQKLMDMFKKASKQKSSGKIKGAVPKTVTENEERLKQDKDKFEGLVKQYNHEIKNLAEKQVVEDKRNEKNLKRDAKIDKLKEKRFTDEIIRKQRQSDELRKHQHERVKQQFLKAAKSADKSRIQAGRSSRLENKQKGDHSNVIKAID